MTIFEKEFDELFDKDYFKLVVPETDPEYKNIKQFINQKLSEILKECIKNKRKIRKDGVRIEINFGKTTVGDFEKQISNAENVGYNQHIEKCIDIAKKYGIKI